MKFLFLVKPSQSSTTDMRYFLFILLFGFSLSLNAQASNDDCVLPEAISDASAFCGIFDNIAATETIISTGPDQVASCWDAADKDVWFTFFTTTTLKDITITLTGTGTSPLTDPQIAIYRGDCFIGGIAELSCSTAATGTNALTFDVLGLDPNSVYFIRVNGAGASEGEFELCLEEYIPFVLITNGSSESCSGTLLDSGGADNQYGDEESLVYTVTPSISNACINIEVASYAIESGFDFLNIYDGPSTSSNLIVALTGTGADVTFQASSGSVTFEFSSDDLVTEDGFVLNWQCSSEACTPYTSIDVTSTVTVEQMVERLITPQVLIENPVINCPGGSFGIFESTGATTLGIEEGVILTTGLAENAEGPNDDDGFTDGTDFQNALGDIQLDTLPGNTSMQDSEDACVFEFDVYAATDELVFDYVFGSDEYPEFAPPNSSFNDVFAFFITGPGIPIPVNIATLPITGTPPASINSINPSTNNEFYIDNIAGKSIEYDGYTTVLQAKADVIPCNYYHLKLAIADRNDGLFDSGVFLADLKAGTPKFVADFDIISSDNITIEGCSETDTLKIQVKRPATKLSKYFIEFGGTATNGVDIAMIPDSVELNIGDTEVAIPLETVNDALAEGVEGFYLNLFNDFGCGRIKFDSIYITIKDEIKVEAVQDTFYACLGNNVQLFAEGAQDFKWTPIETLDNPSISNPISNTTVSQQFYVTGTAGACSDMDSTYVEIVDPTLNIQHALATDTIRFCLTELDAPYTLNAVNNTNNVGITWTSSETGFISNDASIEFLPERSASYIVDLNIAGCTLSDTVYFEISDLPETVLSVNIPAQNIMETGVDTVRICRGDALYVTSPAYAGFPEIQHEWLLNGTPNGTTSFNIVDEPNTTTTYTRQTISGTCSATEEVTVKIENLDPGFSLNLLPSSNPTLIEFGGSVMLDAQVLFSGSEMDLTYEWSPAEGLSATDIANPLAQPLVNTIYTLTVTNPFGCSATADISVNINPEVRIPNIFSPNNDGVNDTFGPIFPPSSSLEQFVIYDRWGELVFDNEGARWDGTLNNKPLPPDAYIYLITVVHPDGEREVLKGDITLIR